MSVREGITDDWIGREPPLCTLRCMQLSECVYDGVPYCLDCVEMVIDREIAMELNPEVAEHLPPLTHGVERQAAFKLSRSMKEPSRKDEPDAWAQLDALHRQWLAAGSPGDAGRAGRLQPSAPMPHETGRPPVTRDEPHSEKSTDAARLAEPAGQLSLLAPEE